MWAHAAFDLTPSRSSTGISRPRVAHLVFNNPGPEREWLEHSPPPSGKLVEHRADLARAHGLLGKSKGAVLAHLPAATEKGAEGDARESAADADALGAHRGEIATCSLDSSCNISTSPGDPERALAMSPRWRQAHQAGSALSRVALGAFLRAPGRCASTALCFCPGGREPARGRRDVRRVFLTVAASARAILLGRDYWKTRWATLVSRFSR